MVNSGAHVGRVVGVNENVSEQVDAGAENIHSPLQSPRLVPEQSLQQHNLEDVVLEQFPTQLEMFNQLQEMLRRMKSAEDALVDCKRKLERRSSLKREIDGPSGPSKKVKGSTQGMNDSSGREAKWCGKCKSKHSSECSASTIKCMNCRKLGHMRRECKEDLRCYNCQGMGHISAACPNK